MYSKFNLVFYLMLPLYHTYYSQLAPIADGKENKTRRHKTPDTVLFDTKSCSLKEKTKYFSLETPNNDNWIAVPNGLLGLIAPRNPTQRNACLDHTHDISLDKTNSLMGFSLD